MGYLRVRNWDRYQHYSDSGPVAWVKLYVKILDDTLVRTLDERTQSHLFKIFALAGRRANVLPDDPVAIGALIDAQSPVNIELLSHWLEEGDGKPHEKSRRQSRLPSKYSTTLSSLNGKEKSTEKRKPADPLLGEKKQWAIDEWNKVAEDRGWPCVSKIPEGNTGELLDARVRDDWWVRNYPEALKIVWGLQWPDKQKPGKKKGLRFVAMLRGDSVRAIVDGEWNDDVPEFREGGSRDFTEDEAELLLAEVLK